MHTIALSAATRSTLLLTLVLCSIALSQGPDWVQKRPIIPGFYVGIGMAQKNRPAAEYTEAAKNIALNDIASQISVSISSDVLRKVFETQDKLGEEFLSQIRASAKADIEGVQLIDTYEGGNDYWVYYKLSRAEYEARRAAKIKNAVASSLDRFSSGRRSEKEGNPAQALGQYAQAFEPIKEYLAEPLEVQQDGRSVFLVNEIYNSLQGLLNRVELNTTGGARAAKIGRAVKPDLELTATLGDKGTLPIARLPVRFSFLRGSGDFVNQTQTDQNGKALCAVQKITASDRIQLIEAKVDIQSLANVENTSPVAPVIHSLSVPTMRFTLNVSGIDVLVEADESMFGEKLQQKRIEPTFKSLLGEKGFSFVNSISKASLVVSIRADARKGMETHGLAFAFVSATVSVLDMETGQEIFKSSVNDVKEGSDTFEKAAYKAFATAANRIADELLPKLVERIQK